MRLHGLKFLLAIAAPSLGLAAFTWPCAHQPSPKTVSARPAPPCSVPYNQAIRVTHGAQQWDVEANATDEYRFLLVHDGQHTDRVSVRLSSERVDRVVRTPLHTVKWHASAPQRGRNDRIGHTVNPRTPTSAAPSRTFYLPVTEGDRRDASRHVRIVADLSASGRRVNVYRDTAAPSDTQSDDLVRSTVATFDGPLFDKVTNAIGLPPDIGDDGRVNVVLTPWLSRLDGGQTRLNGLLRPADLASGVPAPFGNGCDVLFLNSDLSAGSNLETVIAHELAHLISVGTRLEDGHPHDVDWLNEGIAHVVETMASSGWSNLDHRIATFLNAPATYPLAVDDYRRAGRWRDHGCRGAVFLFTDWLVQTHGLQTLRGLVESPTRGRRAVERVTGVPFADLLEQWSLWIAAADLVPADDRSATVDLHRPLNEWNLGGPRWREWSLAEQDCAVEVAGTATAFVRARAEERGAFRISVKTDPPSADVLVVMLRVADVPPRWNIQRSVHATTDGDAGLAIKLRLTDRPRGLHIDRISIERHGRNGSQSRILEGPILAETVRFRGFASAWTAKVVASTDKGRSATYWIDSPSHTTTDLEVVAGSQLTPPSVDLPKP